MPRTKVTKSTKRNREASKRDEKLREFDNSLENYIIKLETEAQSLLDELDFELNMLFDKTPNALLNMRMEDFFKLNLKKFSDYTPNTTILSLNSTAATTEHSGINLTNLGQRTQSNIRPNDEGYLTEESSNCRGSSFGSVMTTLSTPTIGKLPQLHANTAHGLRGRPGPLSSARARLRRSRSAGGDFVTASTLKPKLTAIQKQGAIVIGNANERASRNKLRTPSTVNRLKAVSADRTPKLNSIVTSTSSPQSPPSAIMRWPKPGELVLSKCGSPLVAQVLVPNKYANVNIPLKDGVLALQPKVLSELKSELIQSIEPDTLKQLKRLQDNIQYIVKMAEAPKK